jgi:hypothetical protein
MTEESSIGEATRAVHTGVVGPVDAVGGLPRRDDLAVSLAKRTVIGPAQLECPALGEGNTALIQGSAVVGWYVDVAVERRELIYEGVDLLSA